MSDQESIKVFAPVMTQDVTLPNSTSKVPMVMVPVPNSQMLMAIPTSTLNKREEQQARDLLTWNDGIGRLDGCDLRFRVNQFGCLELIDSDDETKSNDKIISPGSSLLKDGPHVRRPKAAKQIASKMQQNSILMEKLVPKQKLNEIKTTKVEQWSLEDVKDFINSIPGCTGCGELFENQQICGKSLLYLDQRDLIDVIGVKLGPAVKIYHAISLLK